jgi:hypothetical protein
MEGFSWKESTIETARYSRNKTIRTKIPIIIIITLLLPNFFVERWQRSKNIVEVIGEKIIHIKH